MITIHVLFEGYAACGTVAGIPRQWSEGHAWEYPENWNEPLRKEREAAGYATYCVKCDEVMTNGSWQERARLNRKVAIGTDGVQAALNEIEIALRALSAIGELFAKNGDETYLRQVQRAFAALEVLLAHVAVDAMMTKHTTR